MSARAPGPRPWRREPLVWMVLAIPASAVIAGAVMLVLAESSFDGLVADDYYRRGLEINRSLARDAEAVRLGLGAVLSFPSPGVVEARLEGDAAMADGEGLTLRFARAAREGADLRVPLTPGTGVVWRGDLPAVAPGKWYAELGGGRWRLTGVVWMPAHEGGIVLRAGARASR